MMGPANTIDAKDSSTQKCDLRLAVQISFPEDQLKETG